MEAKYSIVVERNVKMQTRDGVSLAADVYRPDAEGRFPAFLLRTPYSKANAADQTEAAFFVPRGYVVVVQDVRGRWESEGDFYPKLMDDKDGYDSVEWVAKLPWCDGNVGMVGQSYVAATQFAAASARPPSLRAISPTAGPATMHRSRGGLYDLGWTLPYYLNMTRATAKRLGLSAKYRPLFDRWFADPRAVFSTMSDEAFRHMPMTDWGDWFGEVAPFVRDLLAIPPDDEFWLHHDYRLSPEAFDTPMFHVGSWYDAFLPDTLAMYAALRERAGSARARGSQKLLLGPWAHLFPFSKPSTGGTGDLDFGPEAAITLHELQLPWFEPLLKGGEPKPDAAPVRIFVMGANRWRDEQEWPLKRAKPTPLYLHSGGRANSRNGDGVLSFGKPGEQPADTYVYDPDNPVPTRGGNGLGPSLGVFDQSEVEARPDVLVYTSAPLEADIEVTGLLSLRLFASSAARDTDFMAKLVDVRPDGYAQNLAEGAVRMRYRNGLTPELLEPGRVYEFSVDMVATSHVFLSGHRIRLDITSSNFPRYDRNANSGAPLGTDVSNRSALQTIFHDAPRPSHLVLPVIETDSYARSAARPAL